MNIVVEQGYPIPKLMKRTERATVPSHTFLTIGRMQAGDSFLCDKKGLARARACCYFHCIEHTYRKVGDNLYRFWRL